MSRRVILTSGKLQVVTDPENVKETGCIYILKNTDRENHFVYKLHCIKNKYYWIALWNSIVHIGAVNGYKTIEHAIKAMIKEGYSIEEYHFDEIFNQ